MSLYSTKDIMVSRPELYMVCTGNKTDMPEIMRLSDLYEGSGGDRILGPYVAFCKIADEQRTLYGLTKEAIQKTIRIWQERGILIPFLASGRKKVIDIMEMLFSQEEVWEMTKWELKRDCTTLLEELMKKTSPLGRINERIAATADEAKLTALAHEFGLQV